MTEKEFSEIYSIPRQTLCNWRSQDRKAGRDGPRPGYPIYRRFGGCIRYWLPDDLGVPAPEAA